MVSLWSSSIGGYINIWCSISVVDHVKTRCLTIVCSLSFRLENKLWFEPECTGSESEGQVGPTPRAFHVAITIDCHMFIFGGRSGGKRYTLVFF